MKKKTILSVLLSVVFLLTGCFSLGGLRLPDDWPDNMQTIEDNELVQLSGDVRDLKLDLAGDIVVNVMPAENGESKFSVTGSNDFIQSIRYIENNGALLIGQMRRATMLTRLSKAEVNIELAPADYIEFQLDASGNADLNIQVYFADVELETAGNVDVKILDVGDLDIESSGSGKFSVESVDNLGVELSGSSVVDVTEITGNADIEIAGAGSVNVGESYMQNLTIEIAGAGNFNSEASVNNLEVEIAGGGSVSVSEVRGSQDIDRSGIGRVNIG